MKRATITMDEYGRVAVPSDAASVWMSEMELVKFFDVIAPTLRAAIRAVYKSGGLNPCEVERRIKLPNGYFLEVYALPMVVALAFHINTPNAARVRNALLERMCLRKGAIIRQYIHSSIRPCGYTSIPLSYQSEEVRFCFFGLFLFAILRLVLPILLYFLIHRFLLRRSA